MFLSRAGVFSNTLERETHTLLGSILVHPDVARRRLINNTIRRLKRAGIWAKRDVIYAIAAHNQQTALLNWKNPTGPYNLVVASGTPVFNTNSGVQGDGTWYLTTNFIPGLAGGTFSKNSANIKLYSRTCIPDTTGGYDFGTLQDYIRLGITGGVVETRLNSAVAEQNTTILTASGMYEVNRDNGSNYDLRHDGVKIQTHSRGSQNLTTTDPFLLLKQYSTAPKSYKEIALCMFGGALSLAESQTENAIWRDYLTELNAIGVHNLDDGSVIWTGMGGNSYTVYRTTTPVKDYSIQDRGEGEWKFKVINGDLAASTTRERSELVGNDLYAWGTDIWINMERSIDHYAPNIHDVIAGQVHDSPNSNFGPPVSLSIDSTGREVVGISYKYTVHADQDLVFPVRDTAEVGSWVKWIIHMKSGLQGGGVLSSTTYGETGRVEVWRWGSADSGYVKVVDYTGDVGYEQFRGSFKLQFGIYSQGTNGAPSYDDGNDSERTFRYRNFYSGTTALM